MVANILILITILFALPVAAGEGLKFDPRQVPAMIKPSKQSAVDFRFVVIGDRSGGHRKGVFAAAIDQVRSLHPDLLINIGDLIEGYTDKTQIIDEQWREVRNIVKGLDAPFILVPGNHDISNTTMLNWWRQNLGASYSAFRYGQALFLIVNTEDPPSFASQAEADKLLALNEYAKKLQKSDPKRAEEVKKSFAQQIKPYMKTAISAAQLQYFKTVLEKNEDARWTFVLLHKPAWQAAYVDDAFFQLEAWLQTRSYTVIAGHTHVYSHEQRYGRDYFTLGTVGGSLHQPGSLKTMDHVLLVTMTEQKPDYANILLSGFVPLAGYSETVGPSLVFPTEGEGG